MKRLGLSLILLVLASLIALGWLGDKIFGDSQTSEGSSVQVAQEVGNLLAKELDENARGYLTRLLKSGGLTDDKGYSLKLLDVDELSLPDALKEQLQTDETLTLQTDSLVTIYHLVQGNSALLALAIPQQNLQLASVKLSLTLLFYASLVLLLMLWIYPLISRIKKLTQVANAVGQGDFSQQIDTSPSSSLHSIETEFNRMSQRIQSLLEDNQLLSGAVSHDLRTPLARLRFGVDALQEQEHSEVSRKYLRRMSQDLVSMERLVSVLLEFVKLDKQLDELPLASVSLNEILMECISNQKSSQSILIKADLVKVYSPIIADERFMTMLVNNLLGNAIKHANTLVEVSVQEQQDLLWLTIEDDGPGFGEVNPSRLIKPFVRGINLPSSEYEEGFGLGLAIVNRIADWFGAELVLHSSDSLGGARVSVGFSIVQV